MDLIDILTSAAFWAAAIRIASPLIFATMGELICERAGVLNLGIEGIMVAGAFAGWIAVWAGLPLWGGVAVAFAAGMAFGLLQALEENTKNRFFQGGVFANAVFFSLILIGFLYVQLSGFNGFRPYSQTWKAMMVVNGLFFLILFLVWAFRSRRTVNKTLIFSLSPLLLFFIIHFTIPDLTRESKSPGPLLEQYAQDISDEDIIISDDNSIRAVGWYLKRSNVYILGGTGELDYGLKYKDAQGRLLDISSAVALIEHNRGKTILVARKKNIARWRNQLPQPVFQERSGSAGYVIWKY